MNKKGFTLIEILIVIAVLSIILSLSLFVYTRLNLNSSLEKEEALVTSLLRQARTLTLSSKNNEQYGVNLGAEEITLFVGNSFATTSEDNLSFPISSLVSVSSTLASNSIVFERLTGETQQFGTITLTLLSATSTTRDIIVSPTGIISAQ